MKNLCALGVVTSLATLIPVATSAEVCDKITGDFGSSGGMLGSLILFLPELIVVLTAATALYADARAGLLAAALIAVAYIGLYILGTAGDVQAAARAEGCAAPRFVVPALFGGLSLLLAVRAFRKRPVSRPIK